MTADTGRSSLPAQWPGALTPDCLAVLDMPTPYLVTDLDTVVRRLHAFTAALPGVHPHYAMKCNPSPEILAALRDHGAGFEIASLGELRVLERLGVDAADVLYSNPVKPPAHIAATHAAGLPDGRVHAQLRLGVQRLRTYHPALRRRRCRRAGPPGPDG